MIMTIAKDWTGCAPSHALWSCVDDDYEPGRAHGTGATPHEAVEDYLTQLSDQDLDALWWDAKAGLNAVWLDLITTENDSRAELNPHQCLDYGKNLGGR
jgi:hypothetical protein